MELGVIVGAVIGAGTATLGTALASRRDNRIRKEQRADARRAELQQAMRSYLAAVDSLTAEMPEDTPPKPPPSRLDPLINKMAGALSLDFLAFIITRLLQRAMYGGRPHQLLDRLADAASHLRLVAPPEVEVYMIESEQIASKYAPHDEQWLETWKDFRQRMRTGFREILDQVN